ncbi:ring-cleaving dioxygenase [Flectobacillus major]|jgi:glyoxalase family protein|uniref:ring-cleaving dioxygenase n=1 Tax=Flectobacillus major TaxID=103 RepID=UPI00041C8113|nr:ring-cleaving dioxygenase [Flectobacillus major]
MEETILGIHHITAIAGDAKRNFDFYTQVLGLRFIKRTVNFDDPYTYHFYYGDEYGSAGTILTFFPWGDIEQGEIGAGTASEIGYSVPKGSLDFWIDRFEKNAIVYHKPATKFGEKFLTFFDPDGLKLALIEAETPDNRVAWETDAVKAEVATKGFHSITLTLNEVAPTARILTEIFGYQLIQQEGVNYRYATKAIDTANVIDLIELPEEPLGEVAGGSVHHVAFRVKNDEILMQFRAKIKALGLDITPQIDRNYFHSLYFREPGGVLFEIATENPGFTVDEPLAELGKNLKLPAQYEPYRSDIEQHLVVID